MDQAERDDLIARAQRFIGNEFPVNEFDTKLQKYVKVMYIFIGVDSSKLGMGETDGKKKSPMNFSAPLARLQSPKGVVITHSLKEVVEYFESRM